MRRWQEPFTPVGCDRSQFQGAYASLLGRVAWTYLVTLTLDPSRHPRSGPESWLKSWRWWLFNWQLRCAVVAGLADWYCQRASSRVLPDGNYQDRHSKEVISGPWSNSFRKGRGQPMWVLAVEPHRDDRLHAHALVMLTRDLPWLDYTVGRALWLEEYGFIQIEKPQSQDHVSSYVTKYVSKGGPDALTFSPNFDAAVMLAAESAA